VTLACRTRSRRFRWISNSEIAAGVMPGILDAMPIVAGRCSRSRWRTSCDSPRTSVVDLGRQRRLFVTALPLDLVGLALDVAAVFRLHIDLQRHLRREPFVVSQSPCGAPISAVGSA
jgi:hypothetical protein